MEKNPLIRKGIMVGLILFFAVTLITPTSIGSNNNIPGRKALMADRTDIFNCYHNPNTIESPSSIFAEEKTQYEQVTNVVLKTNDGGLMNSSWPMYCHDTYHTGRSPYNTADDPPGIIKWCFKNYWLSIPYGSAVIDNNGIIYFADAALFAIYPNGTLKWQYRINGGWSESSPALDSDGIIYIASAYKEPNYLYAIYPNGTTKWMYAISGEIHSSPAIGSDGTIYFGCGQSIVALFSNGTLRWRYSTGNDVYSSPAIGEDGTVYCGCHDTYLYALYPNNGTLKWKFPTGDWVRVSPCIADDGTIYCVSLDSYLYAIYPNGTMKWKTGVGAGTSPTIGPDGTIYAGWSYLCAVNPMNGSVKWVFNPGGTIEGGTPCTSNDGTIYFGTSNGGDLIAVNPDGTEAWRAHIGDCESAPAIGPDGSIYIGSTDNNLNGYLYSFGRGPLNIDANGPYTAMINQPVQLTSTIYGGIPPYLYHWDFGDGNTAAEQNPTHIYMNMGNFTITFTVTDSQGNYSTDSSYATVSAAVPSVFITKPVNGIYLRDTRILPFSKSFIIGRITIQAEASQVPFGIDRVEFYIDGTLKATDTEAPYEWTWSTPAFFKHTIGVIAYDTSGKSTSSSIGVSKFF